MELPGHKLQPMWDACVKDSRGYKEYDWLNTINININTIAIISTINISVNIDHFIWHYITYLSLSIGSWKMGEKAIFLQKFFEIHV